MDIARQYVRQFISESKNSKEGKCDSKASYEKLAKQGKLYLIPEDCLTFDLCVLGVSSDLRALHSVPAEFKTQEFYKSVAAKNGYIIAHVPDKFITPELCKIAIEKDPLALDVVPYEFKTSELCELAVKKSGIAFELIPDRLLTSKICKIMVQKSNYSYALQLIPDRFKTPGICKAAVIASTENFEYVPDKYKTLELCQLAISIAEQEESGFDRNSFISKYIPQKFWSDLGYESGGDIVY